jgi:hypothetical protein
VAIGSQCCSRSSLDTAKSASRACIEIRRWFVAAGPVALCATNSCIIVVSRAENSRFSRPGPASARLAARLRLLWPIKLILPSPSARDFRPPDRLSSHCSPLASCVCAQHPVRRGADDPRGQRILHCELSRQRSIYLAKDQSGVGAHAHPARSLVRVRLQGADRNHRIRSAGALRGAVRLRDSLRGRRDPHARALETVRGRRDGAGVSKRGISPTMLVCASTLHFCEADHSRQPARLCLHGLPVCALYHHGICPLWPFRLGRVGSFNGWLRGSA